MNNIQYIKLWFPNGEFTYVHIWNIIDLNKNEELLHKKTLSDILLRISKNYFNFFIKLCEMNKSLKISNKNNMSNTIASSDKVSIKL